MDLEYTPAQQDLLQRFRSWLAGNAPKSLPPRGPERFAALREWQTRLYDNGWLGRGWPEAYGGAGGEPLDRLLIAEELARQRAPNPAGVVGLTMVAPILLEYGTEQQKARFIQPILSGQEIWCQGYSEPSSGSDLASLTTRAELVDDFFVVNGQKVWTSFAAYASWCIALVRTDPEAPRHRGLSLLAVDMRSSGLDIRPLGQMTGDAEFAEVFFDSVRVPRANLFGDLNAGWSVAVRLLEHERGPTIARRLAEISGFVSMMSDFVGQRGEVGPDIEQRFGECEMLVRVVEAESHVIMTRLSSGEIGVESSVAKLLLTDCEQRVFGLALDLLGPEATTPSELGERFADWTNEYFHARAASIYSGTSQIQRNIIAQRLLGLPRP